MCGLRRTGSVVGWAALVSAAAVDPSEGTEIDVRVIAQSGAAATFVGPALVLTDDFLPQITETLVTNDGHVAFAAGVFGLGVTEDNSAVLLGGRPGALRLVAREGEQAPGLPAGVVFDLFTPTGMSEGGRVLFIAQVRGPGVVGSFNYGIWLETDPPGGAPIPVLRVLTQAPGLPDGITYRAASVDTSMGDDGRIASPVILTGPGVSNRSDSALYVTAPGDPSTLVLLARENEQVAGQETGVLYGDLTVPSWTPEGDLIAQSVLRGAGITSANDVAFLRFTQGAAGSPEIVLREGLPIPGPDVDAVNLQFPLQTNGRDLGFYARLAESATPAACICVGPRDGLGPYRTLALRDTVAPGLGPGVTFAGPDLNKFLFNSARRGVFVGIVQGGGVSSANDKAIFSEGPGGPGSPVLLAREGSTAAGMVGGVSFADMGNVFYSVAINDRNQTAFFGVLQGAGITSDNDNGLWVAGESDAVPKLVAREGGSFWLAAGDDRTVAEVGYRIVTNGVFPWRRWFNDRGEAILSLTFTDGSGAVVLVSVDPPCPADFNGDGDDTLQDLFDFLAAWFARNPAADINNLDGVTVQDLFDFLTAWFGGCP